MKMNKQEVIKAITEEYNFSEDKKITQKEVKEVIDILEGLIVYNLKEGIETRVLGMTIYPKETKARTGRNPQTGEPIEIPAKKVGKIKVGKSIKDFANA